MSIKPIACPGFRPAIQQITQECPPGGAVSCRQWTPNDVPAINQSFWYDPSAVLTITLNGSDDRRIDQMDDKYENYNATGANGNWPFYSLTSGVDGINNLNSIYTTATNRWFELPDGIFSGSTERGFWGIIEDNRSGSVYVTFGGAAAAGQRWTIRKDTGTTNLRVDIEGDGHTFTTLGNITDRALIGCVLGSGGTVGDHQGVVNGSRESATGASACNTATTNNLLFSVDGTVGQAPVRMGEMVMTTGSVDLDTQYAIEGYLAWRWGTQASLPSDHKFKNGPPSVCTVNEEDVVVPSTACFVVDENGDYVQEGGDYVYIETC